VQYITYRPIGDVYKCIARFLRYKYLINGVHSCIGTYNICIQHLLYTDGRCRHKTMYLQSTSIPIPVYGVFRYTRVRVVISVKAYFGFVYAFAYYISVLLYTCILSCTVHKGIPIFLCTCVCVCV